LARIPTRFQSVGASLALLCGWVSAAPAATPSDPVAAAPDRYILLPGDTLWGIASRFRNDPRRWGELWKMNQEQIANPHRIFPGDVIVLDQPAAERPVGLLKAETIKLSPTVRAYPLAPKPVPAVRNADIEPFLSKPLVIAQNQLESAPRIVRTQENRVAVGAGDIAYVLGINQNQGVGWHLFRAGSALVDPDTNETLGYEAIFLGEARVTKYDREVSTIEIVKSPLEIYAGDHLLPAPSAVSFSNYVARAPEKRIEARIISTYGHFQEVGSHSIVVFNRGARDGLEVGHVLAIYRDLNAAPTYQLRESPLYGRHGLFYDEKDPKISYHDLPLRTRDSPLYGRVGPFGYQYKDDTTRARSPRLPEERYGLTMVFRVFDRVSYALVTNADRPVNMLDIATNP